MEHGVDDFHIVSKYHRNRTSVHNRSVNDGDSLYVMLNEPMELHGVAAKSTTTDLIEGGIYHVHRAYIFNNNVSGVVENTIAQHQQRY